MNNPYKPEPPARGTDGPWQARANCVTRNANPELFFATLGSRAADAALEHCENCPVKLQCDILAERPSHTDLPYGKFGIWAGKDPKQREAERRRRNHLARTA